MIEYIDIKKLHEHPDNPRKAIGDVTELMNSIRKQGLLQNLTVVPHPEIEGEYRIVIGHRRYNAAKRAGLSELPCVIDRKMDRRAQIAVMMSENMQRNDLTIAERVGGVQMMMDLGLDIKTISKDTGLSESSVRRYKKLTEISSGIKAAEEKGLTLFALEKIAEIPYEDLREEALNKADYQHIQYKVQTRQAREKTRPSLIETFQKFAEEVKTVEYCSRYGWIKDYRFNEASSVDDAKKFKPDKEKKYVFVENEYYISLYAENKKTGADEQKQKDAERLRIRAKHEKEISEQFRFARRVFMSEIRIRKEQEEAAMRFVLWVMSTSSYLWQVMKGGAFDAAFLQNRPEQPESYTGAVKVSMEEIFAWKERDILTGCVTAAYDRIDQGNDMRMLDQYSGRPKEEEKNVHLRTLYSFMEMLGYKKSDEEEAWLNGTHECFSFPHDEE